MSCGCSSSNANLIGSRPTLTFTFTDIDGVPADPSTIAMTVMDPSGTLTTWEISDFTNPTPGTWVFEFADPLTEVGEWWVYAAAAGGGADAAAETSFTISDIHVPLGP